MGFFRKKCPFCDVCTKQIDENEYRKYCNVRRGSVYAYEDCNNFKELEALQEEQNKRTPKEWIENSEIKPINLPNQTPIEESQPNKKRARDWNPSKR